MLLRWISPLESSVERAESQKSRFLLETYGKQFVCLEGNHNLLCFFPLRGKLKLSHIKSFQSLVCLVLLNQNAGVGKVVLVGGQEI